MRRKTKDKYPHGWCGFCNKPAIGKGALPLPDGMPSNCSIKVCSTHKTKVVRFVSS